MKSIPTLAVAAALCASGAIALEPHPNDCFNQGEPAVVFAEQPESLRISDDDLREVLARIAAHERSALASASPTDSVPVPGR